MPKSFAEVSINADRVLMDQLIAILSQIGFEGFWEENTALRCYIRSERWSDAMLHEIDTIVRTLTRSSTSTLPRISVRTIEEQNWNEEWEKTITPIHATDRIVITPTWHSYSPSKGEIVLTIDPKMSFGTGYHETTRLILNLLQKHIKPDMDVLDLGTGTGVLAIAAIKLGARTAVGVDNDKWSHENAIENVRQNGVEKQVTIIQGELSDVPAGLFDMIVANIQRNIIERLLDEMRRRARIVLLSGLLAAEREDIIRAAGRSNFRLLDEITENEWIAFALE
ncbi:MAG: 50S ribosomal protein L11 methyltransferase [Ignavibacteriae bacterium]|nr:50S ribosomal protein L11 methyltransferase [Ignavibacteriota bacterium]